MKKFTVYAWCADDEGGLGVCLTKKFSPKRSYYPESGWRAQPSEKIGEFDTVEELAEVLYADVNESYYTMQDALKDAKDLTRKLLGCTASQHETGKEEKTKNNAHSTSKLTVNKEQLKELLL